MKENYLNPKLMITSLEKICDAIYSERFTLQDENISKYGVHDDFIFSDILSKHFVDSLPCERKAMMQIIRATINATAEAYYELLEDGYLHYEDLGDDEDVDLNELIDKLKVSDEDDY